MVKIKLRVIGFQREEVIKENLFDAKNIAEVIQHIELNYPLESHNFKILLNGINVDDMLKTLQDDDEVVIIPLYQEVKSERIPRNFRHPYNSLKKEKF